jgi:hypothetical protein
VTRYSLPAAEIQRLRRTVDVRRRTGEAMAPVRIDDLAAVLDAVAPRPIVERDVQASEAPDRR